MNEILALNMETYFDGKMNLMVGLCEQMGLPAVFNKNLEKSLDRKTDIPYGIMAEIVIELHNYKN